MTETEALKQSYGQRLYIMASDVCNNFSSNQTFV